MDACSESRQRKDGAFHFPVFHRKHPKRIRRRHRDWERQDPSRQVLHGHQAGHPCRLQPRHHRQCHEQAPEAGPKLDPHRSATYRHVGCSDEDCLDIQADNGVPYGCVDETDTCLYGLRYGSQYSAGKLGRDRLALGDNYTIVDDFVFGCSEDDMFYGLEAGVIGLGDKRYSFNQMARLTTYNAFAYCFPGDHRAEGFLIVGPYPQKLELVTTLIRVFYALAEAIASAMQDKAYYREYGRKVCFRPAGGEPVNWRSLPTVQMQLLRATLELPPENVFHQQSTDRICLAFQSNDAAGVPDVQILGNKALRSFRVVYDLQKMTFGFQARAC
ncbi:unnamed protein product [Miscanthus lutarioriparius]|uniref:Peptidase A1 domain-containing protein n=1 Tax=Miscanthus lutarioriparius TaxID=422564 RepID=A0A811REP6_9POAL|nr:unnamed protein product [Miscanthus lutarioriparius]